ncbi:MAG: hypothetical protein JSU95_02550 [Betaproteobacteria bacterium]|nr:MAG: hypothetical protein JSU95_02550 [Betaproteobacteria bacterium]
MRLLLYLIEDRTAFLKDGDSDEVVCYLQFKPENQVLPQHDTQANPRPVKMEDKVTVVENALGFLLDAPFMETASDFPSAEDVIEDWHLTAIAFRNVRDKQKIPKEQWEALHLLLSDAIAEYEAAASLGEAPDTQKELGVGYDGYDVPDGFAVKHQAVIWQEVLAVLGSDERDSDPKLISK